LTQTTLGCTSHVAAKAGEAAIGAGDHVRWQDKAGLFRRDLGDGNADTTIANRVYRVRIADLRPG
jgi:hypothetical protein